MKANLKLILFSLVVGVCGVASAQPAIYQTKYVSVTPVVTVGAYSTKATVGNGPVGSDTAGVGVLKFTNITCPSSQKGSFTSVMISDAADNAVEYVVWPFRSLPTNVSGLSNGAAFDPSDTVLRTIGLPPIDLATTDHFSANDNGMSSLSSLSSNAFSSTPGILPSSLYVSLQVIGTPTYAAANDVTVTLGFRCD